jgi:Fe2+ or Zn2+ uptake regulation protein
LTEKLNRRYTRQRGLVLEAVCGGNHPTARELFDSISETAKVSLGTIYRNLTILEEEGEILSIKSDPTVVRYDRRRDPHHHLHCKACGRVFDMPLPYDPGFDREISRKSGFPIDSHAITFEGYCGDCKKLRRTQKHGVKTRKNKK